MRAGPSELHSPLTVLEIADLICLLHVAEACRQLSKRLNELYELAATVAEAAGRTDLLLPLAKQMEMSAHQKHMQAQNLASCCECNPVPADRNSLTFPPAIAKMQVRFAGSVEIEVAQTDTVLPGGRGSDRSRMEGVF